MKALVQKLIAEGVLKTPAIISSFLANDRKKFVPEEYGLEAYVDAPLPIGAGQTISQPYTVAFMMELLSPGTGQKILDVGFGSGWTTAILAEIVGARGRVYGLEIVPEIYDFGRKNLAKFDYKNVELRSQSGWEGLPEAASFDRILVSAAPPRIPQALKEQLTVGGRLVIPVGEKSVEDFPSWKASPWYTQSIKLIKKIGQNKFEEDDYPGFAFVPMVKGIRK